MADRTPPGGFRRSIEHAFRDPYASYIYDTLLLSADITAGTVTAGKALVVDANKGLETLTTATIATLSTNAIRTTSGSNLTITGPASGPLLITLPGAILQITGLPTQDPQVDGYFWLDSDVLTISSGN